VEEQVMGSIQRMSGKERILAALARKPVDRIPFVPLLDQYALAEMPPDILGHDGTHGFGPRTVAVAGRALGCDLIIRHVTVTAPRGGDSIHLQLLGGFEAPVETRLEFDGRRLVESLITPVGTLTGEWTYTDRVGAIPHATEHVVNSLEDLKVFHYAVDHLASGPPLPTYDLFDALQKEIGEDGIATASFHNSPLMYLIEMVWGLENTYYLLNDFPDEVRDILQKLHQSLKLQAIALAESPAQVIIQYENTSSTLLSPAVFREHVLPFLDEYGDILTSAGKTYLIHMCGRLRALTSDISRGRFDGVIDIAPAPTGDLPLNEAAAGMAEKVVIGGIDPTMFLNPDTSILESSITELLHRIRPYSGVMLGSGDVVPRGVPLDSIRLIRRLVDKIGSYT